MAYRVMMALFLLVEARSALALEFETTSQAIQGLLETKTYYRKQVLPSSLNSKQMDILYSRNSSGAPGRVLFLQHRENPAKCAHTWAVAIDPKSTRVLGVHVLSVKCAYGFGIRDSKFLDQYRGVGPAEVKDLERRIHGVARATVSSQLTTQVVKESVESLSGVDWHKP